MSEFFGRASCCASDWCPDGFAVVGGLYNQPPSPFSSGVIYLVGQEGAGDWEGHSNEYALWSDVAHSWEFCKPKEMDRVAISGDDPFHILVFIDGEWLSGGSGSGSGPCPPCEDGEVKLNGTPVGSVPSGDELDVPVTRQGTNTPVGSWNNGASRYEIAPGAAQLKDTLGLSNVGSPVSIPAEQTVNIPLPETHIRYIDASGVYVPTIPYSTESAWANIYPSVTFERREYTINSAGTGAYVTLPDLLPGGSIRDISILDTNGNPITPDVIDISNPQFIKLTIATGGAPTELVFTLAPLDEFSLGDHSDGWTITSGYDIEYTTITDDGASGTWEYAINGGSWTPVGSSLDLTGMAGDVIKVRRSVSTGAGWLKLEP